MGGLLSQWLASQEGLLGPNLDPTLLVADEVKVFDTFCFLAKGVSGGRPLPFFRGRMLIDIEVTTW